MQLSLRDLPFWAKSLIAPTVVLATMLAMAALALVNLRYQEADAANLNAVAFERLRSVMFSEETVQDFQADLYRLAATAATESDKPNINATAEQLKSRLDGLVPLVRTAVRPSATVNDTLVGFDWAARQMIDVTQFDAAYGVMMTGYAQDYFSQLRGILSAAKERAEAERHAAATNLLTGLEHMRVEMLALLVAGAALSFEVALLTAPRHFGPHGAADADHDTAGGRRAGAGNPRPGPAR
jgi:hypothetical protein